jgi:Phage integrase family
MDEWGWEQLRPWLNTRAELPVGPLFCIIDGPTRGRPWSGAAVRAEFRRLAARAGVRRRFAPHQLRHAHALELAREGVALNIIQRQLGHANLGTTSIYLQGIDPEEVITAVRTRGAPTMSASAGLRLYQESGHHERGRHGAPAPHWRSERLDGPTHTIETRPSRTSRRGPSHARSRENPESRRAPREGSPPSASRSGPR